MYSAKLEKKVVFPLSFHGLTFWAQMKEGNGTRPNTNGGDTVEESTQKKNTKPQYS